MGKETPNMGITHNIIAQGTKIVGTIDTTNDIRIDGTLDGNLTCKGKVVIGQQGFIKGNITCSNAEINGAIDGEIQISDTLTLKSTSKMTGHIKTKILCIEPEAQFSGTCEMGNKPASATAPAPAGK